MRTKKIMVGLVIILGVIASVIWFARELKIDRCLDQGGRWNYTEEICEGI